MPLSTRLAAAIAVFLLLTAVEPATGQETGAVPERSITAVLADELPRLLALPGVVGAGEGLCDGVPCIKITVVEKNPGLAARIGSEIAGYRVELMETGEFRALKPGSK